IATAASAADLTTTGGDEPAQPSTSSPQPAPSAVSQQPKPTTPKPPTTAPSTTASTGPPPPPLGPTTASTGPPPPPLGPATSPSPATVSAPVTPRPPAPWLPVPLPVPVPEPVPTADPGPRRQRPGQPGLGSGLAVAASKRPLSRKTGEATSQKLLAAGLGSLVAPAGAAAELPAPPGHVRDDISDVHTRTPAERPDGGRMGPTDSAVSASFHSTPLLLH